KARTPVPGSRWFGDGVLISRVTLAPKVQPVISPAATPWETPSPTNDPSPERAIPVRVLPFQGGGLFVATCTQGVATGLTSQGAVGARPNMLPPNQRMVRRCGH